MSMLKPKKVASSKKDAIERQIFTPRTFVTGFIMQPPGVNPMEAAWHAAAVGLDTEHVRLITREADGGIYFLAAGANEFSSRPNAMTPLASALPGDPGHQGDGAYFASLGSGIVAVVIKEPTSLRCYVGEQSESLRFAGGLPQYWPTECADWVGFRQYESKYAQHIAKFTIFTGMGLAAVFIALSLLASASTAMLKHRKEIALDFIRSEQQNAANQLNAGFVDDYRSYRAKAADVIALGGVLTRFESVEGKTNWEAEFPAWVSDVSSLGGETSRAEKNKVIVSKRP